MVEQFSWSLRRSFNSFHSPLLAAVLMVVAYNMGEWREIGAIVRLSKADIAVWLTTFVLTAFADLSVAVGVKRQRCRR